MIILLRVNLGAFCDYGYLFGAARYSQRQNERKYRSLLGYENTRRPQIIPRRLPPQHLFIGSISTILPLLLPHHFSLTFLFTTFSSSLEMGKKVKNTISLDVCLCGSLSNVLLPQREAVKYQYQYVYCKFNSICFIFYSPKSQIRALQCVNMQHRLSRNPHMGTGKTPHKMKHPSMAT